MNFKRSCNLLKYLVLASGLLGLSLRWTLYATGLDEKGLLVQGHWANTAVWLLTALTGGAIIFLTQTLTGPEEYAHSYRPGLSPALGCLAAALGMGITALGDLTSGTGAMPPIACLLAFGAAVCFALIAFCRLTDRKIPFLLHVVICLAFAMRMVCLYRFWQSNPQLQDYCFYMGAYIALMLTAYHHAAFPCGMGNHRSLWRFSLCAVYLCLLSLKGSPAPWLLLAAAAWAWTNLTSLTPRRRRVRPDWKLGEEAE